MGRRRPTGGDWEVKLEPPFFCVPLVGWSALRLSPRVAATGMLLLSAVATWGTVNGHGPFAGNVPTAVTVMKARSSHRADWIVRGLLLRRRLPCPGGRERPPPRPRPGGVRAQPPRPRLPKRHPRRGLLLLRDRGARHRHRLLPGSAQRRKQHPDPRRRPRLESVLPRQARPLRSHLAPRRRRLRRDTRGRGPRRGHPLRLRVRGRVASPRPLRGDAPLAPLPRMGRRHLDLPGQGRPPLPRGLHRRGPRPLGPHRHPQRAARHREPGRLDPHRPSGLPPLGRAPRAPPPGAGTHDQGRRPRGRLRRLLERRALARGHQGLPLLRLPLLGPALAAIRLPPRRGHLRPQGPSRAPPALGSRPHIHHPRALRMDRLRPRLRRRSTGPTTSPTSPSDA